MAEPYTVQLVNQGDFDGTTPISLTRDNFTVEEQRLYSGVLSGPAGIIPADLFGLFSPRATKLVGVAISSDNPLNAAQVLDANGRVREQINLRSQIQYVLLHGTDRLAALSKDGRCTLTLVVNELSESDHVQWALTHPPIQEHTRARIFRSAGGPFNFNSAQSAWIPNFTWDGHQLIDVDEASNGPIPIASLLYPRRYGAYVSIRYSGSQNDGQFIIYEPQTGSMWPVQTSMVDGVWSRVQYLAHTDMLGLKASPTVAGSRVLVDIEIVRVEPGDRLRGRYAAAALNPTADNL